MKLWLISQNENNGYDTYDSAVVAAETEEEARFTHPGTEPRLQVKWQEHKADWEDEPSMQWVTVYPDGDGYNWNTSDWAAPEKVTVKLIGEAAPDVQAGVVCSSFNAG